MIFKNYIVYTCAYFTRDGAGVYGGGPLHRRELRLQNLTQYTRSQYLLAST